MKKTYIIAVHKNPDQLKRLIEVLLDENSVFYIHVDLKIDVEIFTSKINFPKVYFIKERVNCIWGDFSQVIATINLLKNAILRKEPYSKILFLSGQDYPIQSLKEIDKYLYENKEYEFISFDEIPYNETNKLYVNRVLKYKINVVDEKVDFRLLSPILCSGFANLKLFISLVLRNKIKIYEILSFIRIGRKSIFQDHFKGSNWWAFNYSTAVKMLAYIEKNKTKLDKYYNYTLCADEQFFHTILKELMKIEDSIKIKSSLHHIDWQRKNVSLPVIFTAEDFNVLREKSSGFLFARKFDMDIDESILDLIDDSILNIRTDRNI